MCCKNKTKRRKKEGKMRAKKMFLTMTVVFSMVAIFAVSAHAAWYKCTVEKAGTGWMNHVYIRLSDTGGSFTNVCFVAPDGRKKEMLAIALTAMTTNKNVLVKLTDTAGGSVILEMWLCK